MVGKIPNDVLKIKQDLDAELFGEDQSWGRSENNAGYSLFEGLVRYTRDRLLQLREVTQVGKILNDVLKIKQDLDAELFGEYQSWGHSENNVNAKTIIEIHSEARKNLELRPGGIANMRNTRVTSGVHGSTRPGCK
ncbi:hypothetical protein Lalb_Chr13g0300761 [Lupinus albus]|uniref:Uncharacterized protein n=1 Tax=Lupinus albus TaxID=3870 RepID=A0A6A4PJN5_LUPAL|nr:hypothetical protein Lalb_Chr13g0300761 [Lupinus albus]